MYTSVQALGFHLPKVDPSCSSLWNTYAGESITLKSDMDQENATLFLTDLSTIAGYLSPTQSTPT